ncbi:hypothetical protein BG004_000655 [Podila humilis]|nr:hypothetical protein BG004_000655 [Podila humilis]
MAIYGSTSESLPVIRLPHLDNAHLFNQERIQNEFSQQPDSGAYQFGHAVEMSSSLMDGGRHSTLSAGRWVSLRELRRAQGYSSQEEQEQEEYDDDEIMVWQLEIHSRSALSLNLIFSDFELPSGTEFYVSGKRTLLGAFTAQVNNKADRIFATAPISGDRILLEYYTPRSVLQSAKPRIQLSHVIHGYKPMLHAASSDMTAKGIRRQRDGTFRLKNKHKRRFPHSRTSSSSNSNQRQTLVDQRPPSAFDDMMDDYDGDDDDEDNTMPHVMSGKCNVDVACHKNEFHDQSRSVGVLLTDYNQKYCTGALINNGLQDGRQLFLTANHCTGYANTTAHVVMFNHEKTQCGGPREVVNEHDTAQGLVKLGGYDMSDFTLYEITERIPDDYNVYLAGWSAASLAPTSRQRVEDEDWPVRREEQEETSSPWRTPRSKVHVVMEDDPQQPPDYSKLIPITGIHHPSGDSKKISFFYSGSLPKTCWAECSPGQNFHWKIPKWDQGTTEPGSSGSPLFDADKRIVGQLHGGSASCFNKNGYDVYGGIHASFQLAPKSEDRLSTYLDPEGTGIKAMDGYFLEAARRDAEIAEEEVERPLGGMVGMEKPLFGRRRPQTSETNNKEYKLIFAKTRGMVSSMWKDLIRGVFGGEREAVIILVQA